MPDWVQLSPEHHGGMTWTRYRDYGFTRELAVVPVALPEMALAALALPLAFVRDRTWRLVACLGMQPGHNACVSPDGRWRASYVPAALRGHPFRLDRARPGQLQVDQSAGLLQDSLQGEPLFAEDGTLSRFLRQVHRFLHKLDVGCAQAERLSEQLAAAGLLKPCAHPDLDPGLGLHQVDEGAWNGLPDDSFLKLRHSGAMPLVYAQLVSQGNMARLSGWRAQQSESTAAAGESQGYYMEQEPELEWVSREGRDQHE